MCAAAMQPSKPGRMTKSFYLLVADGDWTRAVPLVIQLEQPPAFAAPDADGWRSTNAGLTLQRVRT